MTSQAHKNAVMGGLQGWSVDAPYPFIVIAIDNPAGMPEGLYWYVVDSRKGSTGFKDRVGPTHKGKLASLYATCHARALYAHTIQGVGITQASTHYGPYWQEVRKLQDNQ